jgi:RNA recognition motif-containing protein
MRLFIGNLPFKATEDDLHDMFQSVGVTPDNVQIMRDKFSGQSRGFGFAEIGDPERGNHAIQATNGRQLLGRPLVVNEARPMERQGGGGRDRGDRGDRRPRY